MKAIFMIMENSKTNEPQKFNLNLSQRLELRSSNKHVFFLIIFFLFLKERIESCSINPKLKHKSIKAHVALNKISKQCVQGVLVKREKKWME